MNNLRHLREQKNLTLVEVGDNIPNYLKGRGN